MPCITTGNEKMRTRLAILLLAFMATLLSACASNSRQTSLLEQSQYAWSAAIRWGDFEGAQNLVDPEYRKEHPITDLQFERYKQVQVTAYDDQPAVPVSETEVRQTVEIGLVNINTQTARSIVDHQVSRYDEAAKKWWLTTGLPDITRHN